MWQKRDISVTFQVIRKLGRHGADGVVYYMGGELDGRCLQERVVYQENVTARSSVDERRYFGLCETPFKTCYSNHLTTMRYERFRKKHAAVEAPVGRVKSTTSGGPSSTEQRRTAGSLKYATCA